MENPFLALFENSPAPELKKRDDESAKTNSLYEGIFAFTLDPNADHSSPSNLLVLQGIDEALLSQDVIGQALTERVLMCAFGSIDGLVVNPRGEPTKYNQNEHCVDTKIAKYLMNCYLRCPSQDEFLLSLIAQNLATTFKEPEIHGEQNVRHQLADFIFNPEHDVGRLAQALEDLAKDVDDRSVFAEVFDRLKQEVTEMSFVTITNRSISLIMQIAKRPAIAKHFMAFNFPQKRQGSEYNKTILGQLFSKSCLPQSDLGQFEFFENPSQYPATVHARTESQIWTTLDNANQRTFELFRILFKSSDEVRDAALSWIGDLLQDNSSRGKLWTAEAGAMMGTMYVSDGFMLNLSSVLLRFCLPFTEKVLNPKLSKLQVKYLNCRNAHLREAAKETTLVEKTDTEPCESEANFITDVFFLTHKSIDLGFRVCFEKFVKINQEIGRQQDLFREMQGSGMADDALNAVKRRTDQLATRFFSLKAALSEPNMVYNQITLMGSTGVWITNVTLFEDATKPDLINPKQRKIFPLATNETALKNLQFIPEFLVGNICETLLLIQRFAPHLFEERGEYLPLICDFVLAFMGSPEWITNPHLRARLAESLNSMLPTHRLPDQPYVSTAAREFLFQEYHYR